jgi:hypothetical protein
MDVTAPSAEMRAAGGLDGVKAELLGRGRVIKFGYAKA